MFTFLPTKVKDSHNNIPFRKKQTLNKIFLYMLRVIERRIAIQRQKVLYNWFEIGAYIMWLIVLGQLERIRKVAMSKKLLHSTVT